MIRLAQSVRRLVRHVCNKVEVLRVQVVATYLRVPRIVRIAYRMVADLDAFRDVQNAVILV